MQLKLVAEKHALVASVDGDLDHHSANGVREVIDREIMRSNAVNIIFDFTDLNFMDSSGIGVIIGRYKMTKKLGGETVIFAANNGVRRIIEMSGLHKIVKLANSLDNALKLL